MTMHFISTGPGFPYAYYIGLKSALKNYPGEIILHITERPSGRYYELIRQLVQETRLKLEFIEIDMNLPIFKMGFHTPGTKTDMLKNWVNVLKFDYLAWRTISQQGGILMGLDSVTFAGWEDLLPADKEMLVPREKHQPEESYTMHGVIARAGSAIAAQIFQDIEGVMQGQDTTGKHRSIIDGKYRWGGAGICPYINRVIENKGKVAIADISDRTLPLFASSNPDIQNLTPATVERSNHPTATAIKRALNKTEYSPAEDRPAPAGEKRFRFHLLGLVHLPCSKEYMACAFTQKNYKLAQMLLSLGHEVFYYGAEGSTVPCTEFIQTHSLSDIRREWGDGDNRFDIGYDHQATGYRHDFNKPKTETTKRFYAKCIESIAASKCPDDFLLITQGRYQQPIDEGLKLHLTAEPGIGYRGSYARFRAFESAYIQNFTYGSQHPYQSINGHYYDRVIPNYFDPADIQYGLQKRDYFLFIGRLIRRKGILTAYLISKELGIPLKIAGQDGQIAPDGSLFNPGEFRIPPGNWEYIGFADIAKRKELMAHARATIVATEYLEPFAGVHIESMLSGTPVITTDFGVFPETVVNGLNGYRCSTLDDFVQAGKNVKDLVPGLIRDSARRFWMDNVKWQYQKWFEDLHRVWESTQDTTKKGWHFIKGGDNDELV